MYAEQHIMTEHRHSKKTTLSTFVALAISLIAGFLQFTNILNYAHFYGQALFEEQNAMTMLWRSGWLIYPAPALSTRSFLNTHMFVINYLPSFFSYFFPYERITYGALVFGLIIAATVYVAYRILESLGATRWTIFFAAVGACAFYCGQTFMSVIWGGEHPEQVTPFFALMGFFAWQRRYYRRALFWFILNATVREDMGALFAIPLACLAASQYWQLRLNNPALAKERLRLGIIFAVILFFCTALSWCVQEVFFHPFLVDGYYYPKGHRFNHLSWALILHRLREIFYFRQSLWIIELVLFCSAFLLKDLQLLAGAIGFLPYMAAFFFSTHDGAATFCCYYIFPFTVLTLLPALAAIPQPNATKKYYIMFQVIMLTGNLIYVNHHTIDEAKHRWTPHSYTYNSLAYQQFGDQLPELLRTAGNTRVSDNLLALYPYNFGNYCSHCVTHLNEDKWDSIDTLIWFEGDTKDHKIIRDILSCIPFSITSVPDTKIRIGRRM